MSVKCAECQCAQQKCTNVDNNSQHCQNCTKVNSCFIIIHHSITKSMNISIMLDNCCSHEACKNNSKAIAGGRRTKNRGSTYEFFKHVKSLYAPALGIEILCISAAEIGENISLSLLGFNHIFSSFSRRLLFFCESIFIVI